MYSPKHFKETQPDSTELILNKLQTDMSEEDRHHFLIEIVKTDDNLLSTMSFVSIKWQQNVLELQKDLLKQEEYIRLTAGMMKIKLDKGYRSNAKELEEALDQFVLMYKNQDNLENYSLIYQRVCDIFGNLSIDSLCKHIDNAALLIKEIKIQQSRAELTLAMSQKIIGGQISGNTLQI